MDYRAWEKSRKKIQRQLKRTQKLLASTDHSNGKTVAAQTILENQAAIMELLLIGVTYESH